MTANQGDTVLIHFTGASEDGKVFASSHNEKPLEFKIGSGTVIPGLEEAIVGMSKGESKKIHLTSDKAFGDKREDLIVSVDRGELPLEEEPEVGQRMGFQVKDGTKIEATITDVTESRITLDANHPLSGENVEFEVKLVDIIQ